MRWIGTGRLADLLAGAAGLVVLGPAAAAAAALILLEDGPPIFFTQLRVGRLRRPFRLIKLRTMRDGRVTRIGRLLRATGLDEITQLVHLLSGEMALVGPRPLAPGDVQRLGWDDPALDPRFAPRPGITGPVQVLGTRSAACSLRLEAWYAAHRSWWLDLQLVAITALVGLLGKSRTRRLLKRAADHGLLLALRDARRTARGDPDPGHESP